MSDRTRPSARTILIVQTDDDAKTHELMCRIRELVSRAGNDVIVVPPSQHIDRQAELNSMMGKLLELPVLVEMPPHHRKPKWRKPETKGRR